MSSRLTISSEKYRYRDLETSTTIRLLKILPKLVDGEIACTLEHFNKDKLPHLPPYSALSYYWGDPEQIKDPKHRKDIYVSNAHGDTTMHKHGLHQNLWEFLDQMYQEHNEEFLWTDFLCLNQGSTDVEIPQQVPRMGDIYREATRTIAWLGRRSPSIKEGSFQDVEKSIAYILDEWPLKSHGSIEFFRLSSRSWSDLKNGSIGARYNEESRQPQFKDLGGDLVFQIRMESILDLPYWKRIWIIQEVALAKQVDFMYGKEKIGFEQFFLAYKGYFYSQMFFSGNQQALSKTKPAVEARDSVAGRSLPIWKILEWGGRCQSTKAADRLYGLLGFLRFGADGAHLVGDVRVDYSRELSHIYWEFAFECRLSRSPLSKIMTEWRFGNTPPERDLYLRYRGECGWVPDYGHSFVLCWTFLTSLRKALMCPGTFEALGKIAKGAKVPPRQRNMALVVERLVSARRAMGHLRERDCMLIGSEPKSWSDMKESQPFGNIMLWMFLQFDKSDLLPEPEKVQAAAIGMLVELEEREEREYGLARWECRARENVSSWPGNAQSVIRFKSLDEEKVQCCLHYFEQGDPTQQKCEGLPLFLDLPEIGFLLKLDVEAVEDDKDAKFAVVSIATSDSQCRD